jgi:glyoxylase-like metal-dependent hydrolase (beta-lactamase superfamily II)
MLLLLWYVLSWPSHPHFDHVGNISTFPPTTALVLGPGAQAHVRPGYPINEQASGPESDFLGREVVDINFTEDTPEIFGMKSFDYFGDGSFFLIDAPGVCDSTLLEHISDKRL